MQHDRPTDSQAARQANRNTHRRQATLQVYGQHGDAQYGAVHLDQPAAYDEFMNEMMKKQHQQRYQQSEYKIYMSNRSRGLRFIFLGGAGRALRAAVIQC